MVVGRFVSRRYAPWMSLAVGVVTLSLFLLSYLVEVRIVVVEPGYGDVTKSVQVLWRLLLGFATLGSFGLGVYNLATTDDETSGPATKVEIKGTGHDIDVYPKGKVDDPDSAKPDQTGGHDESGSEDVGVDRSESRGDDADGTNQSAESAGEDAEGDEDVQSES